MAKADTTVVVEEAAPAEPASAASQSEATGHVVAVSVDAAGSLTRVLVMMDGNPVDSAEVQWFDGTPWRSARAGIAALAYGDTRKLQLTGKLTAAAVCYQIRARVKSGDDYVYSDTVEAAVQI